MRERLDAVRSPGRSPRRRRRCARKPASRSRASFSSSTTSVRNRRTSHAASAARTGSRRRTRVPRAGRARDLRQVAGAVETLAAARAGCAARRRARRPAPSTRSRHAEAVVADASASRTPPSMRGVDRTVPRPILRDRPCFTAFSTSGCRIRFGIRWRRLRGSMRGLDPQPLAEARALDVEVAPRRSRAPRRAGRTPARRDAAGSGRSSASRSTHASALSGSTWMSCAIELRLLKRKCGLICARSAASCAVAASSVSSRSRSCSVRIRLPDRVIADQRDQHGRA